MATQKGAEKWKMKQWLDVRVPALLGSEVIGSIPADESEAAVGRVLKVSLSWITHNASHSFMTIGLKIDSAANNVASTQIAYLENQFSYLHSLVRRHSDALYTYDKLASKDNATIIVKLLVTTRGKVAYSKKRALRKAVSAFLQGYASNKTAEELLKGVLSGDMQREAVKSVGKATPVAKLEIKRIEL
ncbi:MAG: hypothetical protein QXT43_02840 [Candidatus Micrarchaeaceae archaeon]